MKTSFILVSFFSLLQEYTQPPQPITRKAMSYCSYWLVMLDLNSEMQPLIGEGLVLRDTNNW